MRAACPSPPFWLQEGGRGRAVRAGLGLAGWLHSPPRPPCSSSQGGPRPLPPRGPLSVRRAHCPPALRVRASACLLVRPSECRQWGWLPGQGCEDCGRERPTAVQWNLRAPRERLAHGKVGAGSKPKGWTEALCWVRVRTRLSWLPASMWVQPFGSHMAENVGGSGCPSSPPPPHFLFQPCLFCCLETRWPLPEQSKTPGCSFPGLRTLGDGFSLPPGGAGLGLQEWPLLSVVTEGSSWSFLIGISSMTSCWGERKKS